MRAIPKADRYSLSNGHADGMLVKVRCQLCNITHYYRPEDLLKLCEDVIIWDVPRYFRCEKCGQKDYMSANWKTIYGDDLKGLRVRRLVRIRMVRVCDWEDGAV